MTNLFHHSRLAWHMFRGVALCFLPLLAYPVDLVLGGKPKASIILSSRSNKVTTLAVAELNRHLKSITGVELPVLTDEKDAPGYRIYVGESRLAKNHGIDTNNLASQESLVQVTENWMALVGRDDPETLPARQADDFWVAGRWGKAIRFDGSTVFTVEKHGYVDEEGTLECFLYIDEKNPAAGTVLRLTEGNDHVILLQEGRTVRYRSIGKKETSLVSKPLAQGWHLVSATHSKKTGTNELHIDGVPHASGAYQPTRVSKSKMFVGGFFVGFAEKVWVPYTGTLDELRISRVVRKNQDVKTPLDRDLSTSFMAHLDEGSGVPPGFSFSTDTKALDDLPGLFAEHGTLSAVYDFLETECGVRWYLPGELGTVLETNQTLSVKPVRRLRKPAMEYREVNLSAKTGREYPACSKLESKLFALRLGTGGIVFKQGMHSFHGFYERFSPRHAVNRANVEADRPEFFAKNLTQAQMDAPAVPGGRPNLCYSSPELVEQVVKDIRAYFDGKGLKPGYLARGSYFALGPMDMAPYCKCETCVAALRPPQDGIDRGFAGTYWYGFVNKIAREVKKTHPDKFLSVLAYHHYAEPPTGFSVEPNVAVTYCPMGPSMWWDPARRERDRRAFDLGWATPEQKTVPLYLWLYYLAGMMGQTDSEYPDACAFRVPAFMEAAHRAGVRGLYIQTAQNEGYSPLSSQLELYLTLKLAVDPTLKGETLIDEFFRRHYGPASNEMKQLYQELETQKYDLTKYPASVSEGVRYSGLTKELAYRSLLTDALSQRLTRLLEQAAARTSGVEHARVLLYQRGVWDRVRAARKEYLAGAEKKP